MTQFSRYLVAYRVVFNEVVKTNKEYMQDVTVIESDWLYQLAGHYYQYGTVSIYLLSLPLSI